MGKKVVLSLSELVIKDPENAVVRIFNNHDEDSDMIYFDNNITDEMIIDKLLDITTKKDLNDEGNRIKIVEIPEGYDHEYILYHDEYGYEVNKLIIGKDLRVIEVDDEGTYDDIVVPFKYEKEED